MTPKQNTLYSVRDMSVLNIQRSTKQRPLTSPLVKASANYNERLIIFNLIEQLNHLSRGIQRHRGYSMGLLAGNRSFEKKFSALQDQMIRRIQVLTAFANHSPNLLRDTDIERLHYAWDTIRDNWQGDSVLESFEFHSHFVDQLLILMVRLAEQIRQPYAKKIVELVDSSPDTGTHDETSLYQRLLYFSTRQLPRFIEMLGKIRALSVNSAATGRSEPDSDKKLRYLHQCVRQEKLTVFELTNSLQQNLMDQLPSLLTIKTYEYKLDHLLDQVAKEVIEKKVIAIGEEEIFELATDIIDIYWRVVDDSLYLLHRWQTEDLENWLLGS
jgi:hypothetical protein